MTLASSLDQAGPCARDVMDTALLHAVIAGHDPRDSTSINEPVPDVVAAALKADVRGMKIGVLCFPLPYPSGYPFLGAAPTYPQVMHT